MPWTPPTLKPDKNYACLHWKHWAKETGNPNCSLANCFHARVNLYAPRSSSVTWRLLLLSASRLLWGSNKKYYDNNAWKRTTTQSSIGIMSKDLFFISWIKARFFLRLSFDRHRFQKGGRGYEETFLGLCCKSDRLGESDKLIPTSGFSSKVINPHLERIMCHPHKS